MLFLEVFLLLVDQLVLVFVVDVRVLLALLLLFLHVVAVRTWLRLIDWWLSWLWNWLILQLLQCSLHSDRLTCMFQSKLASTAAATVRSSIDNKSDKRSVRSSCSWVNPSKSIYYLYSKTILARIQIDNKSGGKWVKVQCGPVR